MRLGFLIKLTRAVEWWEYKLTFLVAVAYATALLSSASLIDVSGQILFYLAATIVMAIYVSLVNDFTDVEEDLAVGKRTPMAALSPVMRWITIGFSIGLGVAFGFFIWPDLLSLLFYSLTWIAFTLYSVPPFRWKARGVLGVLCDAVGAHLAPSLLMAAGIFNAAGMQVNYGWLAAVGTWAFASGLRGILSHQFLDRSNDIQTETNTFASKVDPLRFRPVAMLIMAIELLAVGVMFVYIAQPVLLVLFPLYFVLVWIRYRKFGQTPVSIIIPKDKPWQILMDDFYQIFFPIGLLVLGAITQPWAWLVLIVHVSLFHTRALTALKDFAFAFKIAGSKLMKSMRNPA